VIRRRPLAAVCAVLLAVAACTSGKSSPNTSAPAPGTVATSSSPGGSASIPAGEFVNPVLKDDFPDPFVVRFGTTYYAYATTDGAQHLQLAKSPDLVTWEELRDPLPKLPVWSSGDTWAPEVAKTGAGYVLYYTAHDSDLKRPDGNGSQCVTVAVSAAPEGPFVDSTKAPLVCQPERGGSIDATEFQDTDGTRYLVWKNDGNCCSLPTRFFIQPLSTDGLKLTGKPTDLGLVNDAQWEGGVIEAPTLLLHDGTYYLFYSGNGYDTEFYSIGYATSKKVTGPYVDAPENPIVASAWDRPVTSSARGPGHQSIVQDDDGELWMAFHAWDADAIGYANGGERDMWIDKLTFNGTKAVVDGPKDAPQPAP
jgi:beta-xylosidase